jgi:hypothetical protein
MRKRLKYIKLSAIYQYQSPIETLGVMGEDVAGLFMDLVGVLLRCLGNDGLLSFCFTASVWQFSAVTQCL